MQTRAMARGELEEPGAKLEIGEQAFDIWAPRLLNENKREVESFLRNRAKQMEEKI